MNGENNAWSHHGGKIRGTDDRRTIARECNDTIKKSCRIEATLAIIVDNSVSRHEGRKISF
jgi:hypothetical protein